MLKRWEAMAVNNGLASLLAKAAGQVGLRSAERKMVLTYCEFYRLPLCCTESDHVRRALGSAGGNKRKPGRYRIDAGRDC